MNEPIDIKTKKIISQSVKEGFDKSLVHDALQRNIIMHWDLWGKLQSVWINSAYLTFKDLDKYVVLIYLIQDCWQQAADRFEYYSYEEFYSTDKVVIDKINLIKISTVLNIPKETIRRKVNELQEEGVLFREGKKIVITKSAYDYQKPHKALEALSVFLEKKSKFLQGETWFGDSLTRNEIVLFIKKYFTIIWLRFLKLQIPFLLRHRKNFGDLETWMIWGNIALHHQKALYKFSEESIIRDKQKIPNIADYYSSVSNVNIIRGVNASSISDITTIPRATVIRKIKWLVKQNLLKRNKKLEYIMNTKGKANQKIEKNFLTNQFFVAEFVTDFFDYYKNSNFKP